MLLKIDNNLQQFIDFHKRNFSDEGLIIWSLEHECLYASDIYLKYTMINEDITKFTMDEISEEMSILSKEWRIMVTDRVLASQRPYVCYFFLKRQTDENYGLHYANIFPLFDDDDQIIAYCTKSQRLRNDFASAMMLRLIVNKDSSKYITNELTKTTERERLVVFLLIIGLSHKEIAQMLSQIYNEEVLANSISMMISRQIHKKFSTKVHSVLIIKAIFAGYLYDIPSKLVEHLPRIIFVDSIERFYQEFGV